MKTSRPSVKTDLLTVRIIFNAILTGGSIVAFSLAFIPGVALAIASNLLSLWSVVGAKKDNDRLSEEIIELSDEIVALQADRDRVLQEAEQRLDDTKTEYMCEQEHIKAQYKELISQLKADYNVQISELEAQISNLQVQLSGLKSDYECRLQARILTLKSLETSKQHLVLEFQKEKETLKASHSQALTDNKALYEDQILKLKTDYRERLKVFRTTLSAITAQVQTYQEQLIQLQVSTTEGGDTMENIDLSAPEVVNVLDQILSDRKLGPLSKEKLSACRASIAQEIILNYAQQMQPVPYLREAA